jgi:ligand-binding sensor domain-containing protein
VIWGVDGGGSLVVRSPETKKWLRESCPERGDLVPGTFNDLVQWGNRLVLGSPYSGLVLFSVGSWKPLTPKDDPVGRRVYGFVVHDEALWVAASDGLFRFDAETLRREKIPLPEGLIGSPTAIGSNGLALVVTTRAGGLAVWENEIWEILSTGEKGVRRSARAMIVDGGRVLIGGAGWLEEWGLMGGYKNILAENALLGRLIVSDLVIRDGTLWVATIGQGLFRRKDGLWNQFMPPFEDLGSTTIYGLTLTSGEDVLVATAQGLTLVKVAAKSESKGKHRFQHENSSRASKTDEVRR